MIKPEFTKALKSKNACGEAIEWAEQFDTWKDLWKKCERGDWMLWIIGKQAGKPMSDARKPLVLAACECARLSLKYVKKGEERPLKTIELVERWVNGDNSISQEDIRNTAADDAATDDAATDDAAAADAAAAAFYAAAAAAFYADAAADDAAAAFYAAAAARRQTLKECADIVRKHYPDFTINN